MTTTNPSLAPPERTPYAWAGRGDINAFFGLMLDNIGDMILMAGLLVSFGFPRAFVLTKMIPGTALGVLTGDLIFTGMAFWLARRSGRPTTTAMPLGLDTPSTFGSVILILGPAFLHARSTGLDDAGAARHAWFIGISMMLAAAIFKFSCSLFSGLIRRVLPRAGLLGSLTAIALVIISFLPLLDIVSTPVVGMVVLMMILATMTAHWRLRGDTPGALAALVVGCLLYYGLHALGLGPGMGGGEGVSRPDLALRASLPLPMAEWLEWFRASWREALGYLPVAIPLTLATVVGGIDCTESAAAVGDEYPTGPVVAVDGFATLVAGLFGGVIQSTPYIGHPAYKAMGARAGYTLATALFVGAAGVFGFFDWIFYLLPKAAVFPILIFVGLEITAQSFRATPTRHYPAVAFACVPALAYLALFALNAILRESKPFADLAPGTQHLIQTVTMMAGGFIVTSLIWGSALAMLIDGRMRAAAIYLAVAGGFAWFGVIHSGLPEGPIVAPAEAMARLKEQGRLGASAHQTPYHWAAAYWASAAALLVVAALGRHAGREDDPNVPVPWTGPVG
ncbi:permease [Tundrisphaera sp. TA3]|uniref:permease n=1 Tax=Tundrisphaera sp. TA3 TaxID=3435775 RepID=UPI003EBCC96C